MGFCIYCNQNVYSNSTCPKCYRTISSSSSTKTNNIKNDGTASSSRINAMFPDQKRLNQTIDKWQDTYGKKAIFNNGDGLSSVTPINRPRQRMMPQFNPSTTASDKVTQPSPENSSVSTPVLSSLASSRSTLTSSSPTNSKANAYFQYQRSRRTSMFTRNNLSGGDEQDQEHNNSPMMGPAPNRTVSTSAIVTSPSRIAAARPTLLNKISEEKNDFVQRRERAKSSPSQPLQDQSTAPPTAAAIAETKPAIASPPSPTPTATASTIIEPKNTESTPRRRKVVKKPCKECGQHVSKKDYRGLKIHTGEVLCFHTFCLFCAKCHQNFNGLEFCTDGKNFYHTECPDSTTVINNDQNSANSSRQGSPLSEEEEPYPQTPPPNSHDTHFDIVSNDNTDMVSLLAENTDLPKKQNVIVPDSSITTSVMCNTCSQPVTDSTCLELANQFYHKECLLCAGCNKTVPTDRKLSKFGDKLYCDHCTPTSPTPTATFSTPKNSSVNSNNIMKKNFSTTTTGLTINVDTTVPKRAPTLTTPSDIFRSRKKGLPRLGGVRTCARCNQSMPFSDTQPGPHASRWHKKCLRCTGCNKQMDSDAHMTVNEETGLCLVHCRECLDETPKPRFVR